ncbi:MAG TPA: hypothetical protein VGD88_06130 [Opitutaceae bacterium]
MNIIRRSLRLLPLIALVFAVLFIPSVAFAQEAAPAAPWYFSGETIAAVIALFTGLVAIWQKGEATKAQKISRTLILGIESATKIPAVAAKQKEIKEEIQRVATRYEVEPVLNALVKQLTK